MSYLNISHIGLINFFFLKTSTRKIQSFILFKILNFSFLKISSYVTSLTINKLKLKNYIKLKKKKKKPRDTCGVRDEAIIIIIIIISFY